MSARLQARLTYVLMHQQRQAQRALCLCTRRASYAAGVLMAAPCGWLSSHVQPVLCKEGGAVLLVGLRERPKNVGASHDAHNGAAVVRHHWHPMKLALGHHLRGQAQRCNEAGEQVVSLTSRRTCSGPCAGPRHAGRAQGAPKADLGTEVTMLSVQGLLPVADAMAKARQPQSRRVSPAMKANRSAHAKELPRLCEPSRPAGAHHGGICNRAGGLQRNWRRGHYVLHGAGGRRATVRAIPSCKAAGRQTGASTVQLEGS